MVRRAEVVDKGHVDAAFIFGAQQIDRVRCRPYSAGGRDGPRRVLAPGGCRRPVRLGSDGRASARPRPLCSCVIDVLSFTTAVSVATGRGIAVVPFPLGDGAAQDLADRLGAALAVQRKELSAEHPWSLSPRSLLVAPHTPRLVLPSPNGSAIAASAASGLVRDRDTAVDGKVVVAGCLRNASATARWLVAHGYGRVERPVWLIGAGERWDDGSLRPAFEDQLGAGVLAERLRVLGCVLSAEADAAATIFGATSDLVSAIASSGSGRELEAMGFPEDAEIAAELGDDDQACVLERAMFVGP